MGNRRRREGPAVVVGAASACLVGWIHVVVRGLLWGEARDGQFGVGVVALVGLVFTVAGAATWAGLALLDMVRHRSRANKSQ